MEAEEIDELEKKFIYEYKNKFLKLKEKIDSDNLVYKEKNIKNAYRDLASEHIKKILESSYINVYTKSIVNRNMNY